MTCREVKRFLNHGYLTPAPQIPREIKVHARSCTRCSQELAILSLTNALVGSLGDFGQPEQLPWHDVRLVSRIKARIREMDERRVGSWDAGIVAIRGWLLAFGATAAILLVLSSHLATSNASNRVGRNNANWSEELVSTNSSPNLPSEEDSENAH